MVYNPSFMQPARPCLTVCLLILAGGCSPERYQRSADRQVREIIARKQTLVPGQEEPFELRTPRVPLEAVGVAGEVEDLRRTPPPQPQVQPADQELESSPQAPGAPGAGEAPAPRPGPAAPQEGTSSAPATPEPPAEGRHAGEGGSGGGGAAPGSAQAPGQDPRAPGGEPPPQAPGEAAPEAREVPRIPARIIRLEDALHLAIFNNRDYQEEKERVYLTALALTLARWDFAPRFFGIISGEIVRDGEGERSGSITSDFGWNWLLASGARLSISAASTFFRFFTGDKREVAATLLSASVTQPLLRGFGSDVVLEPLRRAERDVVYSLRSLERFRHVLVVQVANEFYRVLQARNLISNEYLNWQGLVNNYDRARALAGERIPPFEVDQVEQQELAARNRYLVAVEAYHDLLDRLKVTLHVPVEASMALDPRELDRLEVEARAPVPVDVEAAVETALARRLDLENARDEIEDASRLVRVTADALRAQLDVTLSADLVSGDGERQKPLRFDSSLGIYGVGFDLDLPFDRRAERNRYVASIIAQERAARQATLLEDSVRIDVRDALRTLGQQVQTLAIQAASVRLAETRVESTMALRDAERAETRDVLESQTALVEARNAHTAALINLAVARLEFHRDTGTMRVNPRGQWILEPLGGGQGG